MMKKVKSFNVGDKVFAKVKGYPAWPAKIIADNGKKYEVSFYGTKETGSIKVEDLFYYLKHKDQFYRNLKRKDYQEAVEQIEAEIKDAGTDGNNDEDMETETSTIGDTMDKKGKKRKRESLGEETQANKMQKAPSEEFNESQEQEEKTEEKTLTEGETVTRSGRIVKIKKFSDDEDEDNKKVSKGKKLAEQSISHSETTDETTVKEDVKVEEVVQDTKAEKEDANENYADTTKSKSDEMDSPTKDIVEKSSPLPAKEEFVDVNIVSIGYLETVIAYAEHVKSKSSFYKKREVEPRESLENEVVIAKLPNKLIGIKYNRSTLTCDNEYEQAIEEAQEAKRVLAIKDKLENGSITMESEKNNVIINIKTDEDNLQQKHESLVLERKKTKLKYLKIEASLVDYDCKIKCCLALDKADPKKAYEYMDLMMELDINSLMLKKHPLIVDVMKRLRRYIGNVKEWNLVGDSLEIFEADAEKIRQKAEEVFMKFVSLFHVTDASAFWDVFNREVEKFEEETKDLSESEMFSLCAEPNSRQAFWDSFEDKKEADKIDKEKNIVDVIETENSIDDANSVPVNVQENNLETP